MMSTRPSPYRIAVALGALAAIAPSLLLAQAPSDGMLMPARVLTAGVVYAHESWDRYWEGTLKRGNGNIGTLTTASVTGLLGYGVTERLSVMASLPYVWTEASRGTLHSMSGVQDVTVAAKYRVASRATTAGAVTAFLSASAALPVGDYTPDFYPLSIGTGGGRASARATLGFQSKSMWFASASAAYTWCAKVKLDRAAYYTDGQLYLSNEVAMPNVADYALGAGIERGRWRIPVTLVLQRTLGGGDIRRQDMPFVSNRMDFTRVEGAVMYALPVPRDLSVRIGAARVLAGRNVGQSTTLTSGLFHALHF